MLGWRLVPEDYVVFLKNRVRDLERQNADLLDRLLVGAGTMPLQEETQEKIERGERAAHNLFQELSVEETGDEPASEPLEVESEA